MSMSNQHITLLILYYSRHGSTRALADAIAEGATAAGAEVLLRTVADSTRDQEADTAKQPKSDRDIQVSLEDLKNCDALALGSPTRFGHMASSLHAFFETTSTQWLQGSLTDKPAAVFTSSSSLHGGQESTLLSMALPLLHHGMILVGIPYAEPAVHQTRTGGGPYGASHLSQHQETSLSEHEQQCAEALGRRLVTTASRLKKEQNLGKHH
ncbi:NAD(P)H dehydrogenase (quinone) [Pseudidiomarina planktonica]|uniref:NAD(P)H dehydrogenase (Quinone) n=2 Tax=Pseudidiomarina planktonica TaxID=1323738 RepID=A0A1Y6ETK6_9GAMM|nr:NAD(P)H dehydrogenase (quinone) [Pseudidiomarina planktonica]